MLWTLFLVLYQQSVLKLFQFKFTLSMGNQLPKHCSRGGPASDLYNGINMLLLKINSVSGKLGGKKERKSNHEVTFFISSCLDKITLPSKKILHFRYFAQVIASDSKVVTLSRSHCLGLLCGLIQSFALLLLTF